MVEVAVASRSREWSQPERSFSSLGLDVADLDQLVKENPSLYSFVFGYAAEKQLTDGHFSDPRIKDLGKPDDHDRQNKGDRVIEYKGERFRCESKSLVTDSIREDGDGGFTCKAQIRSSDKRTVTLPDGVMVETSALLRSDLDVVSINLFKLHSKWEFGFVAAGDLPAPAQRMRDVEGRELTDEQQALFVSTTLKMSWPLEKPVYGDLCELLDREVGWRKAASSVSA